MKHDHSKIPIIHLSIEFSIMLIKYAEQLENSNQHIIAKEALKSGTTIGAFVMEAHSVDSNAEYFERIRLADREAHKTWYWLYLCEQVLVNGMNKELARKLEEIMHHLHEISTSGERKTVI